MKKLFVCMIAVAGTVNANAQWDKFGGLFYCKWGYEGGKSSIDKYTYNTDIVAGQNGNTKPIVTTFEELEYKNKAIFVDIEAIKKNMIFGFEFGWGLKKQASDMSGVYTRDANNLSMRFGYGVCIAKTVSIIPTLQYNWNNFFSESGPSEATANPYYINQIGGNQRGIGVNVMVPFGEHILLRGGYMYEWIFRENKKFKGLAVTPDVELYIPLDDEKIYGFAFSVSMPRRTMYETYNPDESSFYQPEVKTKGFLWRASFSLPIPSASSSYSSSYIITVVE
jgi:hypothetical protein